MGLIKAPCCTRMGYGLMADVSLNDLFLGEPVRRLWRRDTA